MSRHRPLPRRLAAILLIAGLLLLYADALGTGFLNDDYLFLEQARTRPLSESLIQPGALGNYYRPLARQLWFGALAPIAGGAPAVFHAAQMTLFLGALALLFDLLRALVPWPGALAGVLYFALLPLQRVNLTWVSCSQDLLALLLVLAAVALWRRGRTLPAAVAFLGACASKEAALPLPLALVAYGVWVERRTWVASLRRAAPLLAIAAGWGVLAVGVAMRHPRGDEALHFGPSHFAAALVHGVQTLLGLEHPRGLGRALAAQGPAPLPLAALAAVAFLLPSGGRTETPERPDLPPARVVVAFAVVWFLAFALIVGPVAAIWSGYFYTLAAVAGALLVGLALRRADRWTWLGLCAALLWWHTGASAVRAFAVEADPWNFTSRLSAGYVRRAAALTGSLSRDLVALEPAPPRGARLFFAMLPPYAGFQMGNGALVRALYRDTTLESHFLTQFSETTAGGRPCRFFYWDGMALRALYRETPDPFFQVGSDLLLLDRPDGAAHAFRRALAEGGNRHDNLYFLGWAELWRGRRAVAEEAWKRLGAKDDSSAWADHIEHALTALGDGDTLAARRELVRAMHAGIGRPEGHALLGELLRSRALKYATLELTIATRLNPMDWASRRLLVDALLNARMEESARRELLVLSRQRPELLSDSLVMRARERLAAATPRPVVEF